MSLVHVLRFSGVLDCTSESGYFELLIIAQIEI